MDERSEGVRDVPDVHAWLLVENFTISRKLLTHCLNTSDVIFPASHAHVKFYANADPVLVALKNVYSTNTDDDTSLGDPVSSYSRLQDVGRAVVDLLTEAWTLEPTNVLKWLLGELVEVYSDVLMGKVTFDALNDIHDCTRQFDMLMASNPLKHDIRKLKKCKTKLNSFVENVVQDHANALPARWTVDVKTPLDTAQLNADIQAYYDGHHISTTEEQRRMGIVQALKRSIRRSSEWRAADLQLYGSSLSTMGTQGCDMDLCLTWNAADHPFVSLSSLLGKARLAHDNALQKRSNHVMGLALYDDIRTTHTKQVATLDKLLTSQSKASGDKPSKLKAKALAIVHAQYFVDACERFVLALDALKDTPAPPDSNATELAAAAQELKHLMSQDGQRKKKLHRLTYVLQKAGCKVNNVIAHARVPIIKFLHVDSNLECDICMENTLATKNTLLLRTYALFDSRVSPLVLAVKRWAKMRGVNDASQNTLSSYSYAILVIHFLQILRILPNLQHPSLLLNSPRQTLNGHDVTFCTDFIACRAFFPVANVDLSVGDLIVRFFDYVATFPWLTKVVSIRINDMTKSERWGGAAKTWRMSIEDPFESTRDLGIVLQPLGQDKVLAEFRRAKQVLAATQSFSALIMAKENEKRANKSPDKPPRASPRSKSDKTAPHVPTGQMNQIGKDNDETPAMKSPRKHADGGEHQVTGDEERSGKSNAKHQPFQKPNRMPNKKKKNKPNGVPIIPGLPTTLPLPPAAPVQLAVDPPRPPPPQQQKKQPAEGAKKRNMGEQNRAHPVQETDQGPSDDRQTRGRDRKAKKSSYRLKQTTPPST
ncbi:hypothetical protein, variant [Aphanomyces astaci]|uniref:Uncharacterized protein n=1 Tax=Aphanomyces astaci TaxID=112090 RepID=W4FBI1_APHAT|nr:hypothetical protein, variant [Aphanomyces astaci]ETV64855.1 hypothetical protein, variant [Aphanomyces astaci]|eukprot:XP_009845673.1 hypothetical protein, variant [Aphanomyces astaci]